MIVQIQKGQLDWFRRKALSSPNEILAILLGHATAKKVVVVRFVYPRIERSSPTHIDPEQESLDDIDAEANKAGLRNVGTIHSHPNWLPIMSGCDMRSAIESKELTSGIVEVTNRRTRVVFWRRDSSLPCELTYT